MGQTSSRARRPVLSSQVPEQHQQDVHIESSPPVEIPPSPSGNPVARVQTTPATTTLDAEQDHNVARQSYDHDHQNQEKQTAITRTSRGSLLRRSLTGFVKPVTTAVRGRSRAISGNVLHAGRENEGVVAIPNAVANEHGDVSGEQKRKEKSRMPWRNSKRWSKSWLPDPVNNLREEEVNRKETSSSLPGVSTTVGVGEMRGGSVAGTTGDVASTSRVEVQPAPKGMETLKGKEKENLEGGSESENHMSVPNSGLEENQNLGITLGDTGKANSSAAAAAPTTTNNSSQVPGDILRGPHVHPIPVPACTPESSSLSPSAVPAPSSMDHSDNTNGNHQQWESSSTDHHRRYRREFSPIGLSALPPISMTPSPRVMIPPFVPFSPSAAPRPITTRQRIGIAPGNNSNNRQFPPPGTLVVVQGIVHTTDVSRSDGVQSNSNHADGETATTTGGIGSNDISTGSTQAENNDDEVGIGRGRSQQSSSSAVDRLSALLGREGGTSSLSMDEGVGEHEAEVSTGGIQLSEGATSREQAQREHQQSQLSSSEQARSTSIISSNSIDVLGTLLRLVFPFDNGLELSIDTLVILFSVAAAATAASLLTGSSEPILSSGLASNPTADSTMNSVSIPSSPSPPSASDAATTGANTSTPSPFFLPPSPFHPVTSSPRFSTSSVSSATVTPRIFNDHVNPSSSSSHIPSSASYIQSPMTAMNDDSSAGRAERIRQAWSMIRERLGLQGNNVSSMSPSTPPSFPSASSPLSTAGPSTSVTSNSGNANLMGLPLSSTPVAITANSNIGVDRTATALNPNTMANASARDSALNGRSGDLREGASRGRERTLRDDTREHMLAEMTRVFNNGLGLGPNASTSAEDFRSISSHRSGERELPPEGSFERFLVELQTELRVALTQGYQSGDGQSGDREEGEVQRQQGQEPVSADTQDSAQGETVIHRENEPQSLGPLELVEEVTEQEVSTDDDMPSLQNVSNNSSSENVDGSCLFSTSCCFDIHITSSAIPSEPPQSQLQEPTPGPSRLASTSVVDPVPAREDDNRDVVNSARNASTGATEGNASIDASGRINWWRLYRFPPVASTVRPGLELGHVPLTSAPASGMPARRLSSMMSAPPFSFPSIAATRISPSSEAGPSRSPSMPSSPTTNDSSTQNASPDASPFTPTTGNGNHTNTGNTVVPVIIVGLQSVNTPNWRPVMPMGPNDIFDEAQHINHTPNLQRHQAARDIALSMMGSGGDGEDEYDGLLSSSAFGSRQRGGEGRNRGWQNRAASALRNLRPSSIGGSGASVENRRGQSSGGAGSGSDTGTGTDLPPTGSRTFLIYVIGGKFSVMIESMVGQLICTRLLST